MCGHGWYLYFPSKYQLFTLGPNGSKFLSPWGETADTRREPGRREVEGGTDREDQMPSLLHKRLGSVSGGSYLPGQLQPPVRLSAAGTGSKAMGQ